MLFVCADHIFAWPAPPTLLLRRFKARDLSERGNMSFVQPRILWANFRNLLLQ